MCLLNNSLVAGGEDRDGIWERGRHGGIWIMKWSSTEHIEQRSKNVSRTRTLTAATVDTP
jgi:hypothetical protein